MDPVLKALLDEFEQKNARVRELSAKGAAISPEEIAETTTLDEQLDALEAKIRSTRAAGAAFGKSAARASFLDDPAHTLPHPTEERQREIVEAHSLKHVVVSGKARQARVKHFQSDEFGSAHQKAYAFGQFCLAGLFKNETALSWCKDNGIAIVKAQTEGLATGGGVLVPPEFENDMIDLREQFGNFRKWAKNTTMRSDTKTVPRRTGGLTAYHIGEGQTITESSKSWDQVGLTARKIGALAKYSSELDEDSVLELGDDLARELAYAFAKKEDQCGFLGDGTSTYCGIMGLAPRMRAVDGTIANIKGLVVASGNLWSEFTLTDFYSVKGRLPEYAENEDDVAWYCHKQFYNAVMERLIMAAGGVTAAEIIMGAKNRAFMGYPVRITQAMPSADANSQVACWFGSLRLAALFGDRRQTTVALSEHADFASDQINIRGTERFDINAHGVGDTSEAGPIIGLISAAS